MWLKVFVSQLPDVLRICPRISQSLQWLVWLKFYSVKPRFLVAICHACYWQIHIKNSFQINYLIILICRFNNCSSSLLTFLDKLYNVLNTYIRYKIIYELPNWCLYWLYNCNYKRYSNFGGYWSMLIREKFIQESR